MYEYDDPHITRSPILAQHYWLFSQKLRMCGSALTLTITFLPNNVGLPEPRTIICMGDGYLVHSVQVCVLTNNRVLVTRYQVRGATGYRGRYMVKVVMGSPPHGRAVTGYRGTRVRVVTRYRRGEGRNQNQIGVVVSPEQAN